MFKLYDKENNKWLHIENSNYVINNLGGVENIYISYYELQSEVIHNVEVLYFIGVTDKNNNRVYDGDYVINSSGRVCEVVRLVSPSYNGWDLRPINSDGEASRDNVVWNDLLVVGNKYDGITN